MPELEIFREHFEPKTKRFVTLRTIESRIIAAQRGREYYDGARENGFGGYVNDGRWKQAARALAQHYQLKDESSIYGLSHSAHVLQIGCHKGFLLEEFRQMGFRVNGTETSEYAIRCAASTVSLDIAHSRADDVPFSSNRFDLVICVGPVYQLSLDGAIRCLQEIQRVSKGHSFITLGAYETQEDYWLYKRWLLLGCTILRKDEWRKVLEHAGYTGDYMFSTAKTLSLQNKYVEVPYGSAAH